MLKRYDFCDLFRMIKQNKIRKNDFIVIYNKEDKDLVDYYEFNGKDFKWLPDKECWLFDNYFITVLMNDWEFSIVYKEEEKEKILKNFNKNA